MPDPPGLDRQGQPFAFPRRFRGVEQAQLDAGGLLREDRDVDASTVPRRTQVGGLAGQTRMATSRPGLRRGCRSPPVVGAERYGSLGQRLTVGVPPDARSRARPTLRRSARKDRPSRTILSRARPLVQAGRGLVVQCSAGSGSRRVLESSVRWDLRVEKSSRRVAAPGVAGDSAVPRESAPPNFGAPFW